MKVVGGYYPNRTPSPVRLVEATPVGGGPGSGVVECRGRVRIRGAFDREVDVDHSMGWPFAIQVGALVEP